MSSRPVLIRLSVLVAATLVVLTGLGLARPGDQPAPSADRARVDLADAAQRPAVPKPGQKDGQKDGQKKDRQKKDPHPGQAGRAAADRGGHARAGDRVVMRKRGRDISWPQCPPHRGIPDLKGQAQPMPPRDIGFVIIGLTNGRGFTRNPCLGMHLRFVRQNHVWAAAYAFATYPTRHQLRRDQRSGPFDARHFRGKLRNAGYASARFNIRTMKAHDFRTPHVWLDVEESSSRPWSRDRGHNRAVVQGWMRAYREAGYTIGFYSAESIWQKILGPAKYRLPEWRTAGPDTPRAALRRCHDGSFQGGRAVVAQWWDAKRDYNRMCPGFATATAMRTYFHKY